MTTHRQATAGDFSPTRQADYDAFCRQQLMDPYPLFDELRAQDPVHWCEPLGSWLVLRYGDAFAGLNDARLMAGRRNMYDAVLTPANREKAAALVDHLGLWLQNQNPPRHARLRKLAGVAFTPRHIKGMTPRIRQIVQDRLDHVRRLGACDFAREFCYWIPATVICDMLGLPQDDHGKFQAWMADLVPFASAAGPQMNDAVERALPALDALLDYFGEQIDARRRRPGEDLLSALVHAQIDGDRLSQQELFGMCVFLFVAGHETTASLLANGTMLLLTHPEQLALFRRSTTQVLDTTIEEMVRFESPVTRAIRWASEDVPLGDRVIREGETVVFLLGAVNRDPAQFPAPAAFDIQRQPNKHLGFGWGRHFCIGAQLARLEAQIAFPMIIAQLPRLRLADTPYAWRRVWGIRSLETLPIRIDKARPTKPTTNVL